MHILYVNHGGKLFLAPREKKLDGKCHINRKKYSDEALQFCKRKYYKPYFFLNSHHQDRRLEFLSKYVLASCAKR